MSRPYAIIHSEVEKRSDSLKKGSDADDKSRRLLTIYSKLQQGMALKKADLAQEFGVTERSIQRDIESLRNFLAEQRLPWEIVMDRQAGGYRLSTIATVGLSGGEILTVCKILLESRSLRRDEMMPILDRLIECCVPQGNQEAIKQLVANEKLNYVELQHKKPLVDLVWDLGQAIQKKRVLEIEYTKLKQKEPVVRTVEPVGLMFSEFYFYLIAYIRPTSSMSENSEKRYPDPAFYRVDRIEDLRETGDTFFSPAYASKFEESDFRKRLQFMYGGKLQVVRFTYSGPSIEAVLDRLPTAKVLEEKNGVYTVRAEVYGSGIDMWLRSQGDYVQCCQ